MNPIHIYVSYFVAFVATFYALKSSSSLLTNATLFVVSSFIAYGILRTVLNALPRKALPDLDKKTVLVTGCDSGFGQRLVRRLDALGVNVYAGCLFPKGEGAEQLKKNSSNRVKILPMDITSDEQVEAAAKIVSSDLGDQPLWCVVNNAGVAVTTEVEWCPLEAYRRMWEVNALGAIRVTKAFLPLVRKVSPDNDAAAISPGRVVFVTSLAGRYTFPGMTAYSMSKSAVCSFADGLRREMRKWSVTVHTIEPTLYRTTIAEVDNVKNGMQKCWESSPEDVQTNYGEQYFQDFKSSVGKFLSKARPPSKISEVVDDMLDAVIGENPKKRYVPSVTAQLREKILTALPSDVLDYILCLAQPKTPPAAVSATSERRNLQSPYINKKRYVLKHAVSMPLPMRRDTEEFLIPANGTAFPFPGNDTKDNKSSGDNDKTTATSNGKSGEAVNATISEEK
ncbi:short-chain dehydrogenase/reductase family 9C member 7-like [Ischnura elegans]|uniref:short-chain dehydrogenase/reductase family 9C member 7-like n=1 Tax=Ischnura elegans TaxID=197161 RepID=UPI001ED8A18B|nr:short-chain dehydrogenase/reductase family 9C member 7-like [Ischnura elegans]